MTITDERRLVTVLFADLVGFTGRAESADPEQVRELQRAYFATVAAEVERAGARTNGLPQGPGPVTSLARPTYADPMPPPSVAAKLLIMPNTTAWISNPDHAALVEPLPQGATWADAPAAATAAILFADDERSLRALLDAHADGLGNPAYLWIAYPKGGRADISRDSLWPIVAERIGMRPITQIALDETWSALRFRPLKPDEAIPSTLRRR